MATDKAFWVEFFPINPATGTTVRVRMTTLNTPAATGIDLGNGEWMPYMTSFPDTEISVFDGVFDGVSEATVSGVEASDTNGFGLLFPSYIWDGTSVVVYKGSESTTTLGALTKIFSGSVTETPSNEEGEIKWSIRDKLYLFDVEAFKTTYAGTTGYEGTAEMKGVSKPFAIGEVLNLEPFLVDPAYLIYQYHGYGRTIGVQGLYENGLGFGAGLTPVAWAGNVAATYNALKAVTLAAGQWVDAPSIGMFRLGGEPLQGGVITCDVKGQEKSVGVLCERIDDVLALLVSQDANLAALVDGGTYSGVYAGSSNQTVGDYFTGPINIGETMARYLAQCGAYYFVSSAGLLRFGFVRMGTPALEIRSDGTTLPVPENVSSAPVSAPYKRIRMGADKVFRVHSLDEISDALYQAVHELQTQLTEITEDFYLAVDDDNLTIQEKIQIAIPTNTQYVNQYIELRVRALALGLSVTTIDAAYTAYTTDRNAISPAWNDTTQNSTGIPATFRANVAALGSALVALSVDISEEDAKRANWGTVASRPTELTDGRILIGIRSTGALQGTIWGGANTVQLAELLETGLLGKSLSYDPDWSKGVLPSNIGLYDNSGGNKVTASLINDGTAPNGSGKVLRVSYDGTGTPNSNPSPQFGGIVQLLASAGPTGVSRPGFYHQGTRVAMIISAKVPVGRTIEHSSNTTGAEGSWLWLTDNAGTGQYQTYIGIRTIGTTGSFGTTGHLFVSGGANVAFNWDIARYEQRELASAALPQLNRLIDAVGNMRADNELITLQGTSASIVGQGPGATAPGNEVLNYEDLTGGGNGVTIIRSPAGARYSYEGGITGFLKISLPVGYTNTMVRFAVDIFNLSTGTMQTYIVSGYNYSPSSSWMIISAQFIGPETSSLPVRFGNDGPKCCVWIGDATTVWQYPKVVIRDVMVGYSNNSAASWKAGWAVTVTTTPIFKIDGGVLKPRAGDAVLGESIFESPGGATATLANFKTALGVAASIMGQGALATKNNVDLSTTQVLPRGSIPASLANNGFSYTSTTTTITISWPTMTVYRSDGSTISVASGSQAVTGLSSGTTYRIYPHLTDTGGSSASMEFITGVSPAFGSPAILYSNSSPNVAAAAEMYFYSRIPMGNFSAATTTSGSGGGGGGGWGCLHKDMVVGGKPARDLEPGDVILTPDGPATVLEVQHHVASEWYELYSNDVMVGKFTKRHLLYHAKSGEAVAAMDVRLGDILKAIDQHYEITGLRLCNDTDKAVGILIDYPHVHFAGESGILCHNGTAKP